MLIKGVTYTDLDRALNETNKRFRGNIRFARGYYAGSTKNGGSQYRVRLGTLDSHGIGGAKSYSLFHPNRYTGSACWHAHKAFLSALPDGAIVETRAGKWKPGDNFLDETYTYYQGMREEFTRYQSDCCDCTGEND